MYSHSLVVFEQPSRPSAAKVSICCSQCCFQLQSVHCGGSFETTETIVCWGNPSDTSVNLLQPVGSAPVYSIKGSSVLKQPMWHKTYLLQPVRCSTPTHASWWQLWNSSWARMKQQVTKAMTMTMRRKISKPCSQAKLRFTRPTARYKFSGRHIHLLLSRKGRLSVPTSTNGDLHCSRICPIALSFQSESPWVACSDWSTSKMARCFAKAAGEVR